MAPAEALNDRQRDRQRVTELLGREPQGRFEVVVRTPDGDPVVIRNQPLLDDGTPMPTLYWLVGAAQKKAVDQLEADGGVRRAEAEIGPVRIQAAHRAYAAERDAAIPADWTGPRPTGGVAGTRQGVKCLHAHYAWYLAGGPDPVGRWVAEQLGGTREIAGASVVGVPTPAEPDDHGDAPAASIDCGTNSTRLLVARPGGPAIERLMRITRLGQDVDRSRRLGADAMRRTLDVLSEYRSVMDRHGVRAVRMTATSAARDASNRDEFFDAAERIVGVRPELLGGDEEGRLSFEGATAELAPATGPWLVVDIGGGSTELVAGPDPSGGPRAIRSLDVGCVRLSERFLTDDPPTPRSLEAARSFVDGLLDKAVGEQPELLGARTMVGLAGTVACLAGVDQGLRSYDRDRQHHYVLRLGRVEEMLRDLAATDSAGRRAIPGVEDQRADVIVGGTIVLVAVMRRFGFDECLTSEADILDGLVLSTSDRPGLPTV